jgi:hypothetical protein
VKVIKDLAESSQAQFEAASMVGYNSSISSSSLNSDSSSSFKFEDIEGREGKGKERGVRRWG